MASNFLNASKSHKSAFVDKTLSVGCKKVDPELCELAKANGNWFTRNLKSPLITDFEMQLTAGTDFEIAAATAADGHQQSARCNDHIVSYIVSFNL